LRTAVLAGSEPSAQLYVAAARQTSARPSRSAAPHSGVASAEEPVPAAHRGVAPDSADQSAAGHEGGATAARQPAAELRRREAVRV